MFFFYLTFAYNLYITLTLFAQLNCLSIILQLYQNTTFLKNQNIKVSLGDILCNFFDLYQVSCQVKVSVFTIRLIVLYKLIKFIFINYNFARLYNINM